MILSRPNISTAMLWVHRLAYSQVAITAFY